MKSDRLIRIVRPSAALLTLALLMVVLGLVVTGPATASSPTPTLPATPTRTAGAIVQFGEDVTVPAGERVDSVVAAGGDVTVDGSVKGSVVAFGGDLTVRGSVGTTIVAFGGDVRLLPGSTVGASMSPQDKSIVLFGGTLTRAPGAQVTGGVQRVDNANWTGALNWVAAHTLVKPWWGFTLVGWIVQTAVFLVLALVAAALMPRQMRAVQRNLSLKPAPSLGWGALTFFVIVPAVLIVLVISIVGLLLVLPYAVVVPLFYFFVITAVAALIAGKVLAGTQQKDNLMLAVTLGVVGTTIVSRIPVGGGLALMAMAVFGSGATVLAVAEWRQARRLATASAPAGVPLGVAPGVAAASASAASWPAAAPVVGAEPATAVLASGGGGDATSTPAGDSVTAATVVEGDATSDAAAVVAEENPVGPPAADFKGEA